MTPAERMLELTALTGLATPEEHFLSITQTGGTGSLLVSELEVEIVQVAIEIEEGIKVDIEEGIDIELDNSIDVEIC